MVQFLSNFTQQRDYDVSHLWWQDLEALAIREIWFKGGIVLLPVIILRIQNW